VKDPYVHTKLLAYFAQNLAYFAVKKELLIKYLLLIIFILYCNNAFCQETKLPELIVNIAEELASDESDPEAVQIYIDRLEELAENPVRLNSSGEKEISRLFFLSDFQIKILLDYAHSSGKIISVYELAGIPGFDKETAEMMIPFITLDTKNEMTADSSKWKNRFLTNISFKSGNNDTATLGPPWKMLTKYMFVSGQFSGGVTAEKDPGEKLLSGTPPLPDFFSANLAYKGSGVIQRLIVGDYSARFGLGTNINTGIRTGLSLTTPGYISAGDEIKPYTSTDENNFFRGVAASFALKNFGLSLLYSKNYLDATPGVSVNPAEDDIESFYQAGIHNTPLTLQKKDAVSDITYGLNVNYNFNNIRFGVTCSGDRFSLPVNPAGNDPKDIFDFKGETNRLYSFYYNSLINRLLFYGEFSTNDAFKYAIVQGVSFRPSDRLTINFLCRTYDRGYFSFHGKGPGSSSTTCNEEGLLGNFTFEALKHLFISAGCDIRYFPWLKYRCSAPSMAMRQEVRARFLPGDKLTFETLFNYRSSMIDSQGSSGISDQKEIITKSLKWSVRYSVYKNLTFGTRIDYRYVDPLASKGILLLEDLNYRFNHLPVSLWFRYCIFNTDSWDSRIYTFENDLLNSFSIPALYGEGSRSYLMINWEISKMAELRVKSGITMMSEKNVTTGDNKELKIQFRLMF
jgi:hypothetical protein